MMRDPDAPVDRPTSGPATFPGMDGAPFRALLAAFAAVPGSSPHASAVLGLATALDAEVDAITIKHEALAYMQIYGDARMFRVPVGRTTEKEQREIFCRAVGRQIASESYDVVHVRGPLEGEVAAARKAELGYRMIYEVASFPDESEGADAEEIWGRAHAVCLDAADLVIVPTEASTRHLAERGVKERVAIAAPGVDIDVYDWRAPDPQEIPRLLYLGSFAADRDLATMLGALREVVRTTPVRMLVAGEGNAEKRARLRAIVDAFDLGAVVNVRGEPRSESLPSVIGAADLCIAPASATPRFQELGDVPQPLLEYLACKRPVVAAGVPGVAEIVRDEREGLLYPPGDEAALAEAILTMLRDPALRGRTAQAGYERVRLNFSSGARRRRMAQIYDALFPGSQRHNPWEKAFETDGTGQVAVAPLAAEGTVSGVSDFPATNTIMRAQPERDTNEFPMVDTSPRDGAPATHPEEKVGRDTVPGTFPNEEGDGGELPPAPTVRATMDAFPELLDGASERPPARARSRKDP